MYLGPMTLLLRSPFMRPNGIHRAVKLRMRPENTVKGSRNPQLRTRTDDETTYPQVLVA